MMGETLAERVGVMIDRYMSKRLRSIPNSCPSFDNAIRYLGDIEDSVGIEYLETIKKYISYAVDSIEEARSINADLRDTCSDIASEKDDEIERLEEEISKLKDEITRLEEELETRKND